MPASMRLKLILLALAGLLLPVVAGAQAYNAASISLGPILTPFGTPATNAAVRVCLLTSATTPCSTTGVTLYSDYNLTRQIANPTALNAQGILNAFVAIGSYLIQVTPVANQPQNVYTFFRIYESGGGGSGNPFNFTYYAGIAPTLTLQSAITAATNPVTSGLPLDSVEVPANYSGSTVAAPQANSVNATAGCSIDTITGTMDIFPMALGAGYITAPTVAVTGGEGTTTVTADAPVAGQIIHYTVQSTSGWSVPVTTGNPCPATVTVGAAPPAPAPVPILQKNVGLFAYTPHVRVDDFQCKHDSVTDDRICVQNAINFASMLFVANGVEAVVDFTGAYKYYIGSIGGYHNAAWDDGTGPTVSDTCNLIACITLSAEPPVQIAYSLSIPPGVRISGNGAIILGGFTGTAIASTSTVQKYSNAFPYVEMFGGSSPQHYVIDGLNIGNAFIGFGNLASFGGIHNVSFCCGVMAQGQNMQYASFDTLNSTEQTTSMSLIYCGGEWVTRAPATGAESSLYLNSANLCDAIQVTGRPIHFMYPASSASDFNIKRRALDCWFDANHFQSFNQGIVNADDCAGLMGYQLGNTTVAVTSYSGSGSGGSVLTLTGANQLLATVPIVLNATSTSPLAPLNGLWMTVSNPTSTNFQVTIPSTWTGTVAACATNCTATATVVRITDQDFAHQAEPDSCWNGVYGNSIELYTRYGRPINGMNIQGLVSKGISGYSLIACPGTIQRQTSGLSSEASGICYSGVNYGSVSCPNPYQPQNAEMQAMALFDNTGSDTDYAPGGSYGQAISYPWNASANYSSRVSVTSDNLNSPSITVNATIEDVVTTNGPLGGIAGFRYAGATIFQGSSLRLNSDSPSGSFCGNEFISTGTGFRQSCWGMVDRESLQTPLAPSILEISHQILNYSTPSAPGSGYVNLFGFIADPLGTQGGDVTSIPVDTGGGGYIPGSANPCTVSASPINTPGSTTPYTATCVAMANYAGVISNVLVWLQGVGYLKASPPAVTIGAPPTGTTATAHAVVNNINGYYPIGHDVIASFYLNAGGTITAHSVTTLSGITCPGAIFTGGNTGYTDAATLMSWGTTASNPTISATAQVTAPNTCSISFFNPTPTNGAYVSGAGNAAWQIELKTTYQVYAGNAIPVTTSTPTVTTVSY